MRTLLSVFRFLLCCWNDHRLDDRVRFEWLVGLVVRKTEENIKRDDWSLEAGEDKALVLAPVCGAREKIVGRNCHSAQPMNNVVKRILLALDYYCKLVLP